MLCETKCGVCLGGWCPLKQWEPLHSSSLNYPFSQRNNDGGDRGQQHLTPCSWVPRSGWGFSTDQWYFYLPLFCLSVSPTAPQFLHFQPLATTILLSAMNLTFFRFTSSEIMRYLSIWHISLKICSPGSPYSCKGQNVLGPNSNPSWFLFYLFGCFFVCFVSFCFSFF